MTVRRLHRLIGMTMLLPFVGWAATGFVFFVKPGYGAAYESLPLRMYALDQAITIASRPEWREVRLMKTILGTHLLVRTDAGWSHLDPLTLQPAAAPTDEQMRALIGDAVATRAERYGNVARVSGNSAFTDTGARITLDWTRMTLQQRGRDTDRIDALYRVHYLQWTGSPIFDKILGFVGLAALVTLTVVGATLAFRR